MVKFFASYRLTGFLTAAVRDLQYDALMMLCYAEFESRVLVPLVYGRALRLSSSLVLFALVAGGTLAGILGALLALPLARRALSHSRYRKQERKKEGRRGRARQAGLVTGRVQAEPSRMAVRKIKQVFGLLAHR